jgi:3-oxoacyl-[acyl-carrier protein] reductase
MQNSTDKNKHWSFIMNTKTILITGASHGIGKAIAERFAREGFRLILNCRKDTGLLEDYAHALHETYGVETMAIPGDVSDHAQVCDMFRRAADAFGGVDVLVNNAGISHIGLLSELSIADWNRIISTNLTSVYSCCHEALPYMIHQKSGCIINISSVWGQAGASCEVAYSASKGGVNSFTRALAKELAPSHISVNAIACGVIDTRMNDCFDRDERLALAEEIPMGRFGTPEEVADLTWQLVTGPSYLTGQILSLDGGWQ